MPFLKKVALQYKNMKARLHPPDSDLHNRQEFLIFGDSSVRNGTAAFARVIVILQSLVPAPLSLSMLFPIELKASGTVSGW